MAYTWKMLLDPSSAILIGAASGTILYGSYRSNDFFTHFRESLELDNNVVHTKTAIIMPIVGSVFLVLLFYFLHWIYYLLLGIMALSALSAFGYLVYPFVDFVFHKIGGIFLKGWEIRWIGYVNVTGIVSFLISVGVITAWLTTFHYLFTDVLAFSLAISALSFVRLPNFKVALLILTLFFFYDIFWVFISPYIFKESVMVSVAVQLPRLPMVIIIPRIASDGFSLLGVGDIVLPGLWLCFLHRFDKLKKTPFLKGYFLKSWIGYILGLVLTLLMLLALQRGQPALLYLVPFTIIPAVCFGWKQGELKNLWTGTVETHHFDDLETNTEGDTALLLGDTKTKE